MPEGSSPLEAQLDHLFSSPLSQFVPVRNAIASDLRKQGRKEEAQRVKALAKPSLAAWVVNQLYWKRRPIWDGLLRAGEELRQAVGRASSQAEPMAHRRQVLSRLLQEAEGILTEGGHAAAAATLKQVHDTLEAISIYGEQLPGEPAGRLIRSLEPPGFEALLSMASAMPAPRSRRKRKQPGAKPTTPAKATPGAASRAARARLAKAEREAARCRREAQQAATRHQELEQSLLRRQSEIEEAEKRLEQLRQRFEELSKEQARARLVADSASRKLEQATEALEAARAELAKLAAD